MLALAVALASRLQTQAERVLCSKAGTNIGDNTAPTTIHTGQRSIVLASPRRRHTVKQIYGIAQLAAYAIHFPFDSAAIKDNEKVNIQSCRFGAAIRS